VENINIDGWVDGYVNEENLCKCFTKITCWDDSIKGALETFMRTKLENKLSERSLGELLPGRLVITKNLPRADAIHTWVNIIIEVIREQRLLFNVECPEESAKLHKGLFTENHLCMNYYSNQDFSDLYMMSEGRCIKNPNTKVRWDLYDFKNTRPSL
jgi:hypothetical protein